MKNHKQSGFTLVELMISMTVFSVIMLISTYLFIQINRFYTKGITSVRLQDSARNIITDISSQIQFTTAGLVKGTTADGFNTVCIGNKQYFYKTNMRNSLAQSYLYSKAVGSNCSDISGDKKDLMPIGARLLAFGIDNPGGSNLYNINIRLIYGDDDLIDKSAGPAAYDQWKCSNDRGSEFCTWTSLATTVFRRI
jgi:prepilin-type N-terminal cleavage/methylation domain-containing protein